MTDYQRYMELSLMDDSSSEDDSPPACTCEAPRPAYFDLRLSPTVAIQPEMLRLIVRKVYSRSNSDPSYFTPREACPQSVLLVVVDAAVHRRAIECQQHHFSLVLGRFLRESYTDVFLEEFFYNRRKGVKNSPNEDMNFTKRRKRGPTHAVHAKDLVLRPPDFPRYGVSMHPEPGTLKTIVRPPTRPAAWRSMLAIFCCPATTAAGAEVATRVTLVDVDTGDIAFDECILQSADIVDFRTKETGMTRGDLRFARRTRDEIRADIISNVIFADTILVGQRVGLALRLLGMHHMRIVEINQIYPRRDHGATTDGYPLKILAASALAKQISHQYVDPIESCSAVADLLKEKMRNGLAFGADLKIVEAVTAAGNPLLSEFERGRAAIALFLEDPTSSARAWFRRNTFQALKVAPHVEACVASPTERKFIVSHLKRMPAGMDARKLAAAISKVHGGKPPLTIIVSIGEQSAHTVFFA